MTKLITSSSLGRKIRWEDKISDLGKSTHKLAEQAILRGDTKEALELMEFAHKEWIGMNDAMTEFAASELSFIVDNLGEEILEKLWRHVGGKVLATMFSRVESTTPEEKVALYAELQRAHGAGAQRWGELGVTEEPERFVMSIDPCGSGGRLRRMGKDGLTSKAYRWSWGKVGVPYYCTHCCVFWELAPTEVLGYPIRIHENVDRPELPCVQFVYKDPKKIPDSYFNRIGAKKDLSLFSKKLE